MPAPTTDLSADIDLEGTKTGGRTLLLAPPSIAAHEVRLRNVFSTYPRSSTDLHMLDRLSAGLITLPTSTYDLILVLADDDVEPESFLASRDIFAQLVLSLQQGGRLRAEKGTLGGNQAKLVAKEAVLAGLVATSDGFTKPADEEEVAVPLRLRRKTATKGANGSTNGVHKSTPAATAQPAGVVLMDFTDDFDDDDELIDEDTLLGEEDLRRPIQQPPECQPKPGQRRKACKDCTCGLAARMEEEDRLRRLKADQNLDSLKLASDDLNELDFTIQGKTGSCGSCSLGDAFRCADCPYLGLPAFKPGEEVTILNNVAQL